MTKKVKTGGRKAGGELVIKMVNYGDKKDG